MARVLLFLYAESPVHAGADASLGVLDLPIQRDGHSGLPVLWGQSLKGALRSHARPRWPSDADFLAAFGAEPPGTDDATDNPPPVDGRELRPGSLSIGDAELVAFPAPTLVATFAWLTCGLSLARVGRKAALAGLDGCPPVVPPVRDQSVAAVNHVRWVDDKAVLGPYVVAGRHVATVQPWARWLAEQAIPGHGRPTGQDHHRYFRDKFVEDLVVVGDDLMARVSVECAEVTPRVQLYAEHKTVRYGPFYTEYLPTETLLAALVEGDQAHLDTLVDLLDGQVLRVGGDETIGKGLMWCTFAPGPIPAAPATTGRVPA